MKCIERKRPNGHLQIWHGNGLFRGNFQMTRAKTWGILVGIIKYHGF